MSEELRGYPVPELEDRIEVDPETTRDDLRTYASRPAVQHVQTSRPLPDELWRAIDDELLRTRPDVTLRVYGHYGETCDLRLLRHVEHVRRFEVDCHHVEHLDELERLRDLDHLGVAVFEATDLSVLDRVTPDLTSLHVGATRSRKPDMAPLARFHRLRELSVEGQSKHIEAVAALTQLEDLTLRSITTPDLRYLAPLERLASLDVKLGGIRSLEGALGSPTLRYLELWLIRGFDDQAAEGLTDLPGLQYLFLQALSRVTRFPDMRASRQLRRIDLLTMRRLTDVDALEHLPALEECWIGDVPHLQPEDLLPVLRNRTLRRAAAGFGSDVRNRRFEELARAHGKRPWSEVRPFAFR